MDRKALNVDEFSAAHGISRAMLYKLWQQGIGPRYMQIGSRRIISEESAAEWRNAREVPPAKTDITSAA